MRTAILGAVAGMALSSCVRDPYDGKTPDGKEKGTVTFVVDAPSSGGGTQGGGATRAAGASRATGTKSGNGHFPEGVPDDYRNYGADADTETYGTMFGGYPDAEAEAEAFERAVEAMAANYEKSPAAKSGGAARRAGEAGQVNSVAPATRAIDEGSEPDVRIDEVTVLLFDPNNGLKLKRIIKVGGTGADVALDPVAGDLTRRQFTLTKEKDCNYKALFIANSRAAIEAYIAVNDDATLEEVRTELVVTQTGKWNAEPFLANGTTPNPAFKPFPMSSVAEDFTIPTTRDYKRQPVELARALAKINISTNLGMDFQIGGVLVLNKNESGRIVPSQNWGRRLTLLESLQRVNEEPSPVAGTDDMDTFLDYVQTTGFSYPDLYFSPGVYELFTGQVPPVMDDEGDTIIGTGSVEDEIFVFEKAATVDPLDNLCLIVLAINWDGFSESEANPVRYFRVNLTKPDASGELVPVDVVRNYVYNITITGCNTFGYKTVKEAYNHPDELEYTVLATEQGNMGNATYNGEYQLTTDKSVVVVPYGGKATLKIYTDYEGGWYIREDDYVSPGGRTTANEKNVADEVEITHSDSSSDSRYKLTIIAGELHKEITVIELPEANTAWTSEAVTPYVGAFWRADQTGERLIALEPDTDWSAFVLDGDDWVVMDARPSTSTSDGLDGNHNDFDRMHRVNSTVGWATGTTGAEGGYFRLGLRNHHAATPGQPARYARVLVVSGRVDDPLDAGSWSDHFADHKLLYLRQGHEADYVMQPYDPAANVTPFGGMSRPMARRFSPYNLTAKAFTGTGNTNAWYNVREWGGGTYSEPAFADYPTQAGAFFRWAHTEGVRAYNPSSETITPWDDTNTVTDVWDVISNDYESCPPGYRRPSSGGTTEITSLFPTPGSNGSEVLQSLLWVTPPSDHSSQGFDDSNSVWGFYADGWFDRRPLGTQMSSGAVSNTAVSTGSSAVAYIGRLFFNPANRASLFFPVPGSIFGGQLWETGRGGTYWTSTTSFGDNVIIHRIYDFALGYDFDFRTSGNSIRCVKEEEIAPRIDLAHAPPGVIGIKHSDLVALQNDPSLLGSGTYSLTIKGSSTYKNTWVERIAEKEDLGSLEDEPVYMVYFKWGSTVAVLGGEHDDTFGPEDVVWVDPDFAGTIAGWDDFSPATPTDTGAGGRYDIPAHITADGHGDPCDLVNGGTVASPSGWKTPTGAPWTYSDGVETSTPFGNEEDFSDWNSAGIDAQWRENENFNGITMNGAATDDGMIYLPAVGFRATDGSISPQGIYGRYWSSTEYSSIMANYLYFTSAEVAPSDYNSFFTGFPIRCVRPVAEIGSQSVGVHATPGVIGYKAGTGELTLRGSSFWDGDTRFDNAENDEKYGGLESEHVYVAYFKFGSLVATSSDMIDTTEKADGNWFDSSDIIAAPSTTDGYIGLDALKTAVDVETTAPERWEQIPSSEPLEQNETIVSNPTSWAQGRGDACTYYFGEEWRTPTNQDNIDFVGQANGSLLFTWNLNGDASAANLGIGTFMRGTAQGTSLPAFGARYHADGGVLGQGETGMYRSSTAYSDYFGYILYFPDLDVGPRASHINPYEIGLAIRCMKPLVATSVTVSPRTLTFNWNAIGTSDAQTITVTADGPWEVSNPDPTNFTVVVTTPGTADNNWGGTFTVVPKTLNTSFTATRTISVTAVAIGAPTVKDAVTVNQRPEPAKVYAAPGMVGIKQSDYYRLVTHRATTDNPGAFLNDIELTIKGSNSYSAAKQGGVSYVETIANNEFGGLESVDVYTVYFKWGSMVAMIGGTGDSWSVDDVVWVNPGFTGTIGAYNSFTAALHGNFGVGGRNDITANAAEGHGDPCQWVGGSNGSGNWKTPTGGPYTLTGKNYSGTYATNTSTPFSTFSLITSISWEGARNATYKAVTYWNDDIVSAPVAADLAPVVAAPVISTGIAPNGQVVSDNRDLFLPAAGYRYRSNGSMENQGISGAYWTSTAQSSANNGYSLYFQSSLVGPSSNSYDYSGYSVRCVQAPAPPPEPESAILYLDGTTLKAGSWGSEVNEGNVLFFKFGGVVGFRNNSNVNNSWNSANHILFNPTATANASYSTYYSIPAYNIAAANVEVSSMTYHTGANVTAGRGDPCQLVGLTEAQAKVAATVNAHNSVWRLPSAEEVANDYVGGPHSALPWSVGGPIYTYTDGAGTGNSSVVNYWTASDNDANAMPEQTPYPRVAGAWVPVKQGPLNAVPTDGRFFLPAMGYIYYSGTPNFFQNGTRYYKGVSGLYWSSTPADDDEGYVTIFEQSYLNPVDHNDQNYYHDGYTIRCVRKPILK